MAGSHRRLQKRGLMGSHITASSSERIIILQDGIFHCLWSTREASHTCWLRKMPVDMKSVELTENLKHFFNWWISLQPTQSLVIHGTNSIPLAHNPPEMVREYDAWQLVSGESVASFPSLPIRNVSGVICFIHRTVWYEESVKVPNSLLRKKDHNTPWLSACNSKLDILRQRSAHAFESHALNGASYWYCAASLSCTLQEEKGFGKYSTTILYCHELEFQVVQSDWLIWQLSHCTGLFYHT